MKLTIKKTDNGYILKEKYSKTEQQDDYYNQTFVFETLENSTKDSIINLLYHILDVYEPNNKFDKENVRIKIEHGNNYECNGCDICSKVGIDL